MNPKNRPPVSLAVVTISYKPPPGPNRRFLGTVGVGCSIDPLAMLSSSSLCVGPPGDPAGSLSTILIRLACAYIV